VADGHTLVREGICLLLEQDTQIEVVGQAASAEDAVTRLPLARPDVAVIASQLGPDSGIEVCRTARAACPDLACLVLAAAPDDEALYAAVMAGAAGFVLKDIRSLDFVNAIKTVALGSSLMDPRAIARVVERISRPSTDEGDIGRLSKQEQRILDLIAQGHTNRQIGAEMFLAEKTVKNYVTHMLAKLKMSSRTEAAIYATRLQARQMEMSPAG